MTMTSDYKQAVRLLPGLGLVPLNEIYVRLKGIGYDGPGSIKLFRPKYWWYLHWRSKRGMWPSTFCHPTLKSNDDLLQQKGV
jgi:sugar phosphate isomerase/epimerase